MVHFQQDTPSPRNGTGLEARVLLYAQELFPGVGNYRFLGVLDSRCGGDVWGDSGYLVGAHRAGPLFS